MARNPFFATVLIALYLSFGLSAEEVSVAPDKLDQFIISPGRPSILELNISQSNRRKIGYSIGDYWNQTVKSGSININNGKINLKVNLPAGYYTLRLEDEKKTHWGLFSLEEVTGSNTYFCMDAALASAKDFGQKVKREALIRMLKRCGITEVRDRLSWEMVNPVPNKWSFDVKRRQFLTLGRLYQKHGIKQMVTFAHSPKYVGGGFFKYPEKIVPATDAFSHMVSKLAFDYFAIQAWNEPDIGSGRNTPGNEYTTLVKMVNAAMLKAELAMPLVGGVFAHHNRAFIESCIENGLMEVCDVISFHCYEEVKRIPVIMEKYKKTFSKYGYDNPRIWITESAMLRVNGKSMEQWRFESAADIVERALVFRELGVEKFFPFLFVHWERNKKMGGLLEKNESVRRNLAAYICTRRLVADKICLGSLPEKYLSMRNYVFDYGNGKVLIVGVGGKTGKGVSVGSSVLFNKVWGIDGRVLGLNAKGKVPAPDGVFFALADTKGVSNILHGDKRQIPKPPTGSKRSSGIYDWNIITASSLDRKIFAAKSNGYTVLLTKEPVIVRTKVFNVGAVDKKIYFELNAENTSDKKIVLRKGTAILKAGSSLVIEKRLDDTELATLSGKARIKLEVTANGKKVLPLVMDAWFEMPIGKQLKCFNEHRELGFRNLRKWKKLSDRSAMVELSVNGNIFRQHSTMPVRKRWSFPEFTLSDRINLANWKGMVMHVRNMATESNDALVLFWEPGRVCYSSPAGIVPADGRWHVVYIPFDDLVFSPANAPDINETLDLDQVKVISLGFANNKSKDNTLDVKNWYLVR